MSDEDLRNLAVSRGAFLDEALRGYRANRGVVIAALQVPSIAALPAAALGAALYFSGAREWSGLVGIGLAWLLVSLTLPGTLRVGLRVARKQPSTMADLARDFDRAPAVLAVTALAVAPALSLFLAWVLLPPGLRDQLGKGSDDTAFKVLAFVTAFTILGLVSLVGNRLVLASYFIVDQRLGPVAALRASWEAMRGIGYAMGRGDLAVDRELRARSAILGPFERPGTRLVEHALVYLYLAGHQDVPAPAIDAPRGPMAPAPAATTPATKAAPRGKYPCPRCGHGIQGARAGDTSVDGCTTCGGVWIDNVTAQTLVQSGGVNVRFAANAFASVARAAPDPAPPLACPVCTQPLERVKVAAAGSIEIDVCRAHGTWFERNELERVAAAVAPAPELSREDAAATYARGVGNIARSAAAAILSALTNSSDDDD
jgi:Zn-finger nucleic acid-binding protein